MKNFQPGGLRNRRDDIGGRPRGDVNSYAPKNRSFGAKPAYSKPFGGDSRSTDSRNYNPKDRAPRENKSYPATCTNCSIACDVPFRPDGSKPVLCRDCYSKKGPATTSAPAGRDRFAQTDSRSERFSSNSTNTSQQTEINQIVKQLGALETKINQILELMKTVEKTEAVFPVSTEKEVVTKAKKVVVKKAVAKVVEKKVVAKKAVTKKAAVKKVAKKK